MSSMEFVSLYPMFESETECFYYFLINNNITGSLVDNGNITSILIIHSNNIIHIVKIITNIILLRDLLEF